MNKPLECVGKKCQKGFELQLLKSSTGYYVGALDADGFPQCRVSLYGETENDEKLNIERDCVENHFCSGNSIGGCELMGQEAV